MDHVRATVVMIEDQVSYAEAFGLVLSSSGDFVLAGRASDGLAGVELCLSVCPDIIVTDYRLPDGDTGVAVANRLRSRGATAPVVILTGFVAPQVIRESVGIADVSVLGKNLSVAEVVAGFRCALAGTSTIPNVVYPVGGVGGCLSAGELEVVELLAHGVKAALIAEMLNLSVHTIRSRIKHALRKLDASSQLEATTAAVRLGLVVPPN